MRKALLTYGTLSCVITALILPLASYTAHHRSSRNREIETANGRPRSMRERMLEQRQSAARGDLTMEAGERDAFDKWFYDQRTYPGDTIPLGAIAAANQHADNSNFDERDVSVGPKWTPIGPGTIPDGQTDPSAGQLSPVSGRVSAIAGDPSDPNTVYVAGAQGGVWKTTNAFSSVQSWAPLTDHEASLAVGAIAVDPVNPNIIYVGTGEANRACDSYYGQGILRSIDGGSHWTLLGGGGDPFGNKGPFTGKTVSKILIDPATAGSPTATTIWAATTFGFFESGTVATCDTPNGVGPVGLWRSTDSGQTWQLQNVPSAAAAGGTSVQDAVLDPTNGNIVYAAVRSTGVFKSVNAKAATAVYALVNTGFPTGSNVSPMRRINLAIGGPAAPNALYAAVENNSGSALFGLFRSSDGGATWSNIDAGFSGSATFANVDVDPGPGVRLRGLVTRVSGKAFTTDGSWNGRRLLVTLTGTTHAVLSRTVGQVIDADHLLLTTTTGFAGPATALYSVANYPSYCDGQCFYDMTIAVDPAAPSGQRLYVGGNPEVFFPNHAPNLNELMCNATSRCSSHTNWRSDDGGLTWSSISQGDGTSGSLHTDDHAYAFGSDGTLYDGNDGGIWRSGDRGLSWRSMNTNLAITQFQGVALDPHSDNVLGGTQDNGTNLRNAKAAKPPAWFHADFGDGGMAVIDQSTPARMFHTYFNQAFNFMGPARSDIGGVGGPGSWPFVGAYFGYGPQYYNGLNPTDPVSFYAPLTQHPAYTPNVIYFGTNRVYRSPDPKPFIFTNPPAASQPVSWTAVSPVLTKPSSTGGVTGAYVSWIGVLPTLVNGKEILYTGASDGRVSVSSTVDGSGVAAWAAIDKAPLPNRAVTDVVPVASDPTGNTVYVTFSGFNGATPATPGHVFVSTNGRGAAAWTDLSGDLPDVPVNAIAVIDSKDSGQPIAALYVGTDIGVFESLDGGSHWRRLSRGMPNVAVFGLALDTDGHLIAATHGRGMFSLSKSQGNGPK